MGVFERLALDSPDWDDASVVVPVGANKRLEKLVSPSKNRNELISEFVDWTFDSDLPELAFYYGSPYLVDAIADDVDANWEGLKAYAETVLLALSSIVHDARKQITSDRDRISKLMVDALQLIETKEAGTDKQWCLQLFLGCVAAVNGDDVLGRHIQHADF